jgi:hypothetical protein
MRGLLVALVLLTACAPAPKVLEIRDLDAGGPVIRRLALGNGEFRLEFTHSMYGGWVSETYLTSRELTRTGVRTQNPGAAEYYALYGNLRRLEGEWVVDVAPLQLARLPVRVDRTGRPALILAGQRVELLELVPDGHLAELRVSEP